MEEPVHLGYHVPRAFRPPRTVNHLPFVAGIGTVLGSFLWTCRAFLNMAREVSDKFLFVRRRRKHSTCSSGSFSLSLFFLLDAVVAQVLGGCVAIAFWWCAV